MYFSTYPRVHCEWLCTCPQDILLPAIYAAAYPKIPAQLLPEFILSNGPDFKFLRYKHNPLQIPKKKKSRGVTLGLLGDHGTEPSLPIHPLGNVCFMKSVCDDHTKLNS
jgi:hypothetical protein